MKTLLCVNGDTIADTWEESIWQLIHKGDPYAGRYWPTHYPPQGYTCTMIMRIANFNKEPRICKGFTCTPDDFLDYREEIVNGTKRPWEYTYNERMTSWGNQWEKTNQIKYAVECLNRKSDTHKAVLTLGNPLKDSVNAGNGTHIPCLREVMFELEDNKINTTLYWRARDAINAAPINLFGLSFLVEKIAIDLSVLKNKEIEVGSCTDITVDYHVNSKDIKYAEIVTGARVTRDAGDRYWTTQELEELTGLMDKVNPIIE